MKVKFPVTLLRLIILVVGVSLIVSCSEQEIASEHYIPAGFGRMTLRLPSCIAASSSGVAEGSQAENRIAQANLFVFNGGILEKAVLDITDFTNSGNGPEVSVLLANAGKRNVYLIANTTADPLKALTENSSTEQEFLLMLTEKLTGMAASPFIMSGGQTDVEITLGQSAAVDLTVKRLVSRFNVTTSDENLTITSVSLSNTPAQSTYFETQSTAEIPSIETEAIDASTDGNVILYSYSYKSDDTPLSIKLKGEIHGKSVEYIFGLKDAQGAPAQFDRNNIYTVRVSGGTSPEATLTATISVEPWTISDEIFDVDLSGSDIRLISHHSIQNATTFSMADSLFETAARGDEIKLSIAALKTVTVNSDVDWLTAVKADETAGIQNWKITVAPNQQTEKREGTVTLDNGVMKCNYKISQFDVSTDRYLVLVVAGQSNAVGYDESPKDLTGADAPEKGVYQLGLKGDDNLKIIELQASAQELQDMARFTDSRNQPGTKGIHLPLAKLLMTKAPAGYNVIVIPVSYGGAAFSTSTASPYNTTAMKPDNLDSPTRWGKDQAYYRTMLDRTKFMLNANSDNKFIGVVWCQGEHDLGITPANHYAKFTEMTDAFFSTLNAEGLGNRCPRGTAGKDMWYNYSTTPYFYHTPAQPSGQGNKPSNSIRGTSVFGGYKVWNPNTFIHVPENFNNTNMMNGTGKTSSARTSHFGNDAFRKVIAPLVMNCILENGGLNFDGSTPAEQNRFNDPITVAQANNSTGSLGELQNGLLVYLPFENSNPALNMASSATQRNVNVTNSNLSTTQVSNLPYPGGGIRTGRVLDLSPGNGNSISINIPTETNTSWTFSFMLKRSNTTDASALLKGSGLNGKLFAGFKSYSNETCANMIEFSVQPSYNVSNNGIASGVGRLVFADKVRSYDDWIYYAVSYDKVTKIIIVYMNGQNVCQTTLSANNASDISDLILAGQGDGFSGTDGYMDEFYLWNRVLSAQEIQKNYIMSYFGIKK